MPMQSHPRPPIVPIESQAHEPDTSEDPICLQVFSRAKHMQRKDYGAKQIQEAATHFELMPCIQHCSLCWGGMH